ncbi:hypothetical protein N8508_00310 [bacterium]|nr:hypothetical protein [bacterium]
MSEFHIGQQVICVDDAKPKGYHPHAIPNWVVKDSEYIIRGFADNDGIVVGVWLEELVNPLVPIGLLKKFQEPAFATWRFRKGLSAFEIAEEKKYAKSKEKVEVIETDGGDEVESITKWI